MSFRFMRVIVFFDLPMLSDIDRREYTIFRKYLLKSGFVMLQQSVYSKLTLNTTVADAVMGNVRKNKPPAGLVQMITLTEKQFSKMEFLVGKSVSDVIDSGERLIVL